MALSIAKILADVSLVISVTEVLEFKVVEAVSVADNLERIEILSIENRLSNSLLIVAVTELKERIANLIAERSIA